jgi:hypothetical protein
MTDWADDSDGARTVTPPDGSPAPRANPGWYPDPWTQGQHRYWNGTAWTSHAFPDGPGPAGRYSQSAAPTASTAYDYDRPTVTTPVSPWAREEPTQAYPAAGWSGTNTWTDWQPSWSSPPGGGNRPSDTTSGWPPTGRRLVVLLVLMVLLVGGISMGATYLAVRKPSNRVAQTTIPTTPGLTPGQTTPTSPSSPSTPADPATAALAQMVVNQGDVPSTVGVQPLVGGDQVSGQTTLDLCNGTFPSESLRSARLQVAVVDSQGDTPISTEAVAYQNPAATAKAFTELKATAAACPSNPVVSPVGEPTVATKFNPAPDGSWPQVAGVDRLAFDFVSTDGTGQTHHSVAVYLRRGRFLMGVYFSQPDGAQIAVSNQTTIPGIVNLFASRMAAVPPAVANGSG